MKDQILKPTLLSGVFFASLRLGSGQTPPPVSVASSAPEVQVGDRVPPLNSVTWVKGGPESLGKSPIKVISFWASWCPSCLQAMGPLSNLARKYEGRVRFINVSVWENPSFVRDGSYVTRVQKFAAKMPGSVAVDNKTSATANLWLGRDSGDIPKSFVIDSDGRLAWSGHPLAELSEVLKESVENRFSTHRASSEAFAQVKAADKMIQIILPIEQAMTANAMDKALEAIESAVRSNPDLESSLGPTKFHLLLSQNQMSAYTYSRTLASGACKECPSALNLMAWAIVDPSSGPKSPDISTAKLLAEQADALSNHQDPYILDTLALVHHLAGHKSRALELQSQAVKLARASQEFNPKILSDLVSRLSQYSQSKK
jgi:thiol-disulfide isomerase/thioredoxin